MKTSKTHEYEFKNLQNSMPHTINGKLNYFVDLDK